MTTFSLLESRAVEVVMSSLIDVRERRSNRERSLKKLENMVMNDAVEHGKQAFCHLAACIAYRRL
jgi:hypothetical protein